MWRGESDALNEPFETPYLAQLNDLYCDVCVCGGNQSYYALEECLGENKRDFRACKKEMEALKKCSDSKNLVRHPLETTAGSRQIHVICSF